MEKKRLLLGSQILAIRETNTGFEVRRGFRDSSLARKREDAERLDRLLADAHDRVRRDFSLGLSGCPTMLESLETFLADPVQFPDLKPDRRRFYTRVLSRFARELSRGAGDIAVDRIAREDLDEWLRQRRAEPGHAGKYQESPTIGHGTITNELRALKIYAKWCCERRWCSFDIDVLRLQKARVPGYVRKGNRPPPRALHEFDFLALLRRVRRSALGLELVIRGMLLLGGRPEAIFRLDRAHYVPPSENHDGEILLPALKGGVPTRRPISQGSLTHRFMDEVLEYAHGIYLARDLRLSSTKPLFPNRYARRWATSPYNHALSSVVGRLRLGRRFTAYMARHSAITWLIQRGVDPYSIQQYAKHLSISTQEIYNWTTGERAGLAYTILEGILGGDYVPAGQTSGEGKTPLQNWEQMLGPLFT